MDAVSHAETPSPATFDEPSPAEAVLFCLPYAGGNAGAFWTWQGAFGSSVRLSALTLPGRDGVPLAGGAPAPEPISAATVASEIRSVVRGPFAIYGHSMGARLAFEVTRELAAMGAPLPTRLFVGAAHPPHLPEPLARIAHISTDEFIEQLILRAGAPEELRDDQDVRAALMPALRTDLGWLKAYRYRHEPALGVPIVAFAGSRDREVSPEVMLGWARHSAAGFRMHTVDGGHLFLSAAGEVIAGHIERELAAPLDGAPPPVAPEPDEVHVWRAKLDRMPELWAATDELEPAQRARAESLDDERERGRYVAQCALARRLVRAYGPGVHYGVSRSRGTALIAVSRDEIGVDVERVRPIPDFDAFLAAELTQAQRAEVAAEPEEEQLPAALRFCTATRALRKVTGLGPWHVAHLDLDGAVGAIVTTNAQWRLRFETLGDRRP